MATPGATRRMAAWGFVLALAMYTNGAAALSLAQTPADAPFDAMQTVAQAPALPAWPLGQGAQVLFGALPGEVPAAERAPGGAEFTMTGAEAPKATPMWKQMQASTPPWSLYPTDMDKLPNEPESPAVQARVETFVPADKEDPVGKKCSPGDGTGQWYYNVSKPTLLPFMAKESTGVSVIVVPGGGYRYLAWQKEGVAIARWLNSIGINAFVLKYRVVSTPITQPIEAYLKHAPTDDLMQVSDVQRAVSTLRYKIDEMNLGLNKTAVGVIGFGIGGYAAAKAGSRMFRGYDYIDAVDDYHYEPNFVLLIYGGAGSRMEAVRSPPTFIAIAEKDQCMDSSVAETYHLSQLTLGKTTELHMYHEGHSGYGDCSQYVQEGVWEDSCAWVANAELFIKAQVLNKHEPLDVARKYLPLQDFGRTFR